MSMSEAERREELFKLDWRKVAARVTRLSDFTLGWGYGFDAGKAEAVRLRERVDELRHYAQHHGYCPTVPNGIDGDCKCGLLKVLEASR